MSRQSTNDYGHTLLEQGASTREEFWRQLSYLPPDFASDVVHVARWFEDALGHEGIAYVCQGKQADFDFIEGDLFMIAVDRPSLVVQFDVHLHYIIVVDGDEQGEAGDWLDDRAGQALRWLEGALHPSRSL